MNDYVPFYFTPHSPMALNIKTGYNNITKRPNDDIIILVAKIEELLTIGLNVIFTDRHAYLKAARYFSDIARLDQIDWKILQGRDFKRDANDPEKMDRYMAEVLVHGHVPIAALHGIATYTTATRDLVQGAVDSQNLSLKVSAAPGMYF